MAMLDRYRKPGGFYQLLALLETCGPQKQEKFLEIVRSEDVRWAEAIKKKMLDINRIYAWNDETLAEIIGTLQDLTLATALHAAPAKIKDRINKLLSHSRKRKIDDLIGTSKPSPGEVATMHMKIIETVRKMAHDGFIRFEKIDPDLHIDDNFEESLMKGAPLSSPTATTTASASSSMFKIEYDGNNETSATAEPAPAPPATNEAAVAELSQLRKKMNELSKENAVLRHELSVVKNKLDQIKKIA